jgi:hypothetical protein
LVFSSGGTISFVAWQGDDLQLATRGQGAAVSGKDLEVVLIAHAAEVFPRLQSSSPYIGVRRAWWIHGRSAQPPATFLPSQVCCPLACTAVSTLTPWSRRSSERINGRVHRVDSNAVSSLPFFYVLAPPELSTDCITETYCDRQLQQEDARPILEPIKLHRVNILERDEATRTRTVIYESLDRQRNTAITVTHRSTYPSALLVPHCPRPQRVALPSQLT